MASVPDGEEAAPPVTCQGGGGRGEAVRAGAGPREERGGGGRARGHGWRAPSLTDCRRRFDEGWSQKDR